MDLSRLLRHLFATRRRMRRAFTDDVLDAIERAVRQGERQHGGEVRFAIESDLDWRSLWAGQTPRERALEVFAALRVWDTELNNGILVYVLFADRDVEIVADRGYRDRVPDGEWEEVCAALRERFARSEYEAGAIAAIEAIHQRIRPHFPATAGDRDELPDRPAIL